MTYARRTFAGAAAQTTITGSITASSLAITIAAATGWPTGAEFYAVIDPGQATEEKILCTRSGTTLTLASTAKRGVDGTTASSHSSGATIYPCVTAADLNEANELVSTLTTKGDVLTVNGSGDFARLAAGATGYVLTADSGQTTGLKWTPPGKVLQVVQATYSTQSTNTSNAFADTGLSASITPLLASSKVLVLVNQQLTATTTVISAALGWQLLRGSTVVFEPQWSTDEAGYMEAELTSQPFLGWSFPLSMSYMDSPATTSSTTYKTQFKDTSGTAFAQYDGATATMLLMEIGA